MIDSIKNKPKTYRPRYFIQFYFFNDVVGTYDYDPHTDKWSISPNRIDVCVDHNVTDNASVIYDRDFSYNCNLLLARGIVTGKQIGRASCRERVSSPV